MADTLVAEAAPRRMRAHTAAPSVGAVLIAALIVVGLLWAAWVTVAIRASAERKPAIASVRLQAIVEDYVQAQARTSTPAEQVTRETQAFMAALDAELKARGASGTTVLVAEAVLSKNVPDITADVRRAVMARVPAPGAGDRVRD